MINEDKVIEAYWKAVRCSPLTGKPKLKIPNPPYVNLWDIVYYLQISDEEEIREVVRIVRRCDKFSLHPSAFGYRTWREMWGKYLDTRRTDKSVKSLPNFWKVMKLFEKYKIRNFLMRLRKTENYI